MKTAIVTGGNRGIGFEISRQLDALGFQVILGSRNIESGIAASYRISKRVIVKQLDITNEEDLLKLFTFVKSEFGCLDVLINNAGISEYGQGNSTISGIKSIVQKNFDGVYQVAKKVNSILRKNDIISAENTASNVKITHVKSVMETNFFGAWRIIQLFIPLLKKSGDGRIINISSGMGELNSLSGFYPAYSMSKASLNALTIMFSNELKNSSIKVNAICPGWVKTEMGGFNAPKTVTEGADTAIWLATEDVIPTGKFFRDRKEISW